MENKISQLLKDTLDPFTGFSSHHSSAPMTFSLLSSDTMAAGLVGFVGKAELQHLELRSHQKEFTDGRARAPASRYM